MKKLILFFVLALSLGLFTAAVSVFAEDAATSDNATWEEIKCNFSNSSAEEKCYSDDGLFSCSGNGSCVAKVYGRKGTAQNWKSSCGNYVATEIDGKNESINFDCKQAVSEQIKCVFNGSQSEQKCYDSSNVSNCGPDTQCFNDDLNTHSCAGEKSCVIDIKGIRSDVSVWESTCGGSVETKIDGQNKYVQFDCGENIAERVRCSFAGSETEQKCYATISGNEYSCTGQEYCSLEVKGKKGERLTWKSSCGGYAYTTLNGLSDSGSDYDAAEFSCATTTPPMITIVSPNAGDNPIWTIGSKQTVSWMSKNVPERNLVEIRLKSLGDGGYKSLIITQNDGSEEIVVPDVAPGGYYLDLKSEVSGQTVPNTESARIKIVSAGAAVSEKVKCVFGGSQEEQKCYAATDGYEYSCAGIDSCVIDVDGSTNERVVWKSSCGGYAYTTMDGKGDYDNVGEYAKFDCSPTIVAINDNANDLVNERFENILFELKQLRDTIAEKANKNKYLDKIVSGLKDVSDKVVSSLNDFITYGVDENTEKLGAGERSAVIASYQSAFAKLPETETEMADAIKIANGRFPSDTSQSAEKMAKEKFFEVYKRVADETDQNDNAAIKIMAYGLRQKASNRNLESEKSGIKTFKSIFGTQPSSTEDWNVMQAITYSGASKKIDSDKDGLADETEKKLNTDPWKADSDGDGYADGIEVLNGYDPLKKK